jgi:hypothetical protein
VLIVFPGIIRSAAIAAIIAAVAIYMYKTIYEPPPTTSLAYKREDLIVELQGICESVSPIATCGPVAWAGKVRWLGILLLDSRSQDLSIEDVEKYIVRQGWSGRSRGLSGNLRYQKGGLSLSLIKKSSGQVEVSLIGDKL